MTIEELHCKLVELQIPEDSYYLHGLYGSPDDNDKIALTIRKGKYTIEYETYFKERGEKQAIKTFTNEDEVANWLLKKLVTEQEFWKSQRSKSIEARPWIFQDTKAWHKKGRFLFELPREFGFYWFQPDNWRINFIV